MKRKAKIHIINKRKKNRHRKKNKMMLRDMDVSLFLYNNIYVRVIPKGSQFINMYIRLLKGMYINR